MAIRTNISYSAMKTGSSRKSYSRSRLSRTTGKAGKPRKSWAHSKLGKQKTSKKVRKMLGILGGVIFLGIFIGTIGVLAVVAKYSSELPNPDEPFVKDQEQTSIIYDRNGNELYQFFGDKNREIVQIEDIPLHVRWAFLAAEDVDFYHHKGVDTTGILRCGFKNLSSKDLTGCGGSTITQQMIKSTVLTNEKSYERKIKEIILSLRVEQEYSKNEILQLYLNEIGFGGNVYGIKTAARVYFGKEVQDLNLSEAALLAGLPQAPGTYSPLFASDLELARELSVQRQEYVFGQMEEKMDKINKEVKDPNFITLDLINQAREQELVYKRGKIDIEAPHFVFYVRELLKEVGYNNGEPFTENDLRRGGLRITTTLDLDTQHVAEDVVKRNVDEIIAPTYGVYNSSLVAIDPNNGDVLAMVGSKDYNAEPLPEGCTLGVDCKFEPDVNVALSYRQPGSSLKPFAYYKAFDQGILTPASFLPDIPIIFSNNYEPKNYGNDYFGLSGLTDARHMLLASRNIPAVQIVETVGVDSFLDTMEEFGYAPVDRSQLGAAVILGAREVTLLEHTGAYGVFATNGMRHPTNPILKIEDKQGDTIYEKEKDPDSEGKRVASEQASFLINDILGDKSFQPGPYVKKFIGDYALAGKTGTTDESQDAWFIGYSPDIVVGVWSGNNDHTGPKTPSADGSYTSLPTWYDFMNSQIWKYDVNNRFTRPGGVVNLTVCADSGLQASDDCGATKSELFIQGKEPKKDDWTQKFEVCKDQKDHLARSIDKQLGLSTTITVRVKKMLKEEWQQYLDKAAGGVQIPKDDCTKDRNPTGNEDKPWIDVNAPKNGYNSTDGKLPVDIEAYSVYGISNVTLYFDNDTNPITTVNNLPYKKTLTVTNLADGDHVLKIVAEDNKGQTTTSTVSFVVGAIVVDTVTFISPANGTDISTGDQLQGMFSGDPTTATAELVILKNGIEIDRSATQPIATDGSFITTWPNGLVPGPYTVYFVVTTPTDTIQSAQITLT